MVKVNISMYWNGPCIMGYFRCVPFRAINSFTIIPWHPIINHERKNGSVVPAVREILPFYGISTGLSYAVDGSKNLCKSLCAGGKANLKTGSDSIILEQKTNYPWDGRVEITFNSQKPEVFELKMRIPGWALNQRCHRIYILQ
jgi:hypothetical protein